MRASLNNPQLNGDRLNHSRPTSTIVKPTPLGRWIKLLPALLNSGLTNRSL
jgi:hypothetical protein